jgi:hypothetical protein
MGIPHEKYNQKNLKHLAVLKKNRNKYQDQPRAA